MKEKILDIFYNQVLVEIANGVVNIDDFIFFIEFTTTTKNKKYISKKDENLLINDFEKFNEYLIIYVNKMLKHLEAYDQFKKIDYVYYNGDIDLQIKFVLATLFNNATNYDFANPIEYLIKRTNFLDDELKDKLNIWAESKDKFFDNNIKYKVSVTNPVLETFYKFKQVIYEDNEEYLLPDIYYGISNEVCYIYAINLKSKNITSQYTKKINRLLYKLDSLVDLNSTSYFKDTTKSHVLALLHFLKVLKNHNIENVSIVDYMPIRHHAKEKAISKKQDDELLKDQERIDKNMIEKPIYEALFLTSSFDNIKVVSYPDLNNNLKLKILEFENNKVFLNKEKQGGKSI